MKKIIPILTIAGIGAGFLISGLNTGTTSSTILPDGIKDDITHFQQDVNDYSKTNDETTSKVINSKYRLNLVAPYDAKLVVAENDTTHYDMYSSEIQDNMITSIEENTTENETKNLNNINNINFDIDDTIIDNNEIEDEDIIINDDQIETDKISTLYSLTDDIDSYCEEFITLKRNINDSITETENLITKLNNNEIILTNEQKMFILEQSNELKSLGKKLSGVTKKLNINLYDISNFLKDDNGNLDQLSLKYMFILDNLVNGNEMLESGLQSLNMINNLFRSNNYNMPPNNHGRIMYGFRQNDNQPIFRDYYIDENGNMVDNNNQETETETENNETITDETSKINVDTYNTFNLPRNIDTFYNTALLNRMNRNGLGGYGYGYGMNNYGMNGYGANMNNMTNPYMNDAFANNSVDNNAYTQNSADNSNSANNTTNENTASQREVKKPKRQLKKNVDTYRTDETPSLSTRFNNFKQKISNLFSKAKQAKPGSNNKAENPIFRFDSSDSETASTTNT